MAFEQTIYSKSIADGMPRPLALLIVSQAKHETNNFTSSVFLQCNNAFGYGAVRSNCPGHSQYQNYPTVTDSVHELTGWILRRLSEGNFPPLETITTPEQYGILLKNNNYYEADLSEYVAGLRRWFSDNIGTIAGVSFAGVAVALAIAYLLFKKDRHIYKM